MSKSAYVLSLASLLTGLVLGFALFHQPAKEKGAKYAAKELSAEGYAKAATETVFSCSMHSHIRQQEAGTCPLCGMKLTSEEQHSNQYLYSIALSPEAAKLAEIQTQIVQRVSLIEKDIHIDGKLALDESRVYNQVAHLPGRIEKLYVNKTGVYIKKGRPIASIYSKDLIAVVEALSFSKKSESILRAARNNLKNWKISENRLREFDVKGEYLKAIDIYSDFNGIVLKKLVVEGDYTSNSHMGHPTVLFEIADLSRLWALFDLYEKDLSWVAVGNEVQIDIPAYPFKSFQGRIDHIDPLVNPFTKTISLRVELDNLEGLLKPDMQIKGKLIANQKIENQISVPKSSVLWTGRKSIVYLKKPEYDSPVFEFREVVLGGDMGDYYWILKGLEEGEEIVTNGAFSIDASAQIANKRSMMNMGRDKKQDFGAKLVKE